MFAIFAIPSALTYMLGRMVKSQRHGWAGWAAMFVLFFAGVATAYWAEARGNPIHARRGIDVATTETNPGGNMEGGTVRLRQLRPLRHRHHFGEPRVNVLLLNIALDSAFKK
jgi:K+-transporting ATPase ATPase A chain